MCPRCHDFQSALLENLHSFDYVSTFPVGRQLGQLSLTRCSILTLNDCFLGPWTRTVRGADLQGGQPWAV